MQRDDCLHLCGLQLEVALQSAAAEVRVGFLAAVILLPARFDELWAIMVPVAAEFWTMVGSVSRQYSFAVGSFGSNSHSTGLR